VALTAESNAIRLYEPRQIWKEAALSKFPYVPLGFLAIANCCGYAWKGMTTVGARLLFFYFERGFL